MLIRKHDNFEKTLLSQSDKIDVLQNGVGILDECQEPDVARIRQQYDDVMHRHARLLEDSKIKRLKLEDSLRLQDFISKCTELINWINSKIQLAYDDNLVDSTNLRSKLQRHEAFDAELQQSDGRFEAIKKEGEKLISEAHYDSEQIQLQLNAVLEGWNDLRR